MPGKRAKPASSDPPSGGAGDKPRHNAAAWSFRVFVVERMATHSERAIADLRRALDAHLPEGYQLEVIDLREHPELARKEQLIVLPAAIREHPQPHVRLTGNFSDEARVVATFGLASASQVPRGGGDADG